MTAMSSMHWAVCGKRSETSMPLWPYLLNLRLEPSSRALGRTNWYFASPNSSGFFSPLSWLSSGLGSNVSMWLGPPAMNRKMTDLAFASLGDDLAASGFPAAPQVWSHNDANASEPKPQKASRKNSRRAGQKSGLIDIKKHVEVEYGEGEFFEWLILQEF